MQPTLPPELIERIVLLRDRAEFRNVLNVVSHEYRQRLFYRDGIGLALKDLGGSAHLLNYRALGFSRTRPANSITPKEGKMFICRLSLCFAVPVALLAKNSINRFTYFPSYPGSFSNYDLSDYY